MNLCLYFHLKHDPVLFLRPVHHTHVAAHRGSWFPEGVRFLDALRFLILRRRCRSLPSNYSNSSLRSEVKTLHSMKGLWCSFLCLLPSFKPDCCFNWGPTQEARSETRQHPAVRKSRFDCWWMEPLMSVCFYSASNLLQDTSSFNVCGFNLHIWWCESDIILLDR